MARVRLDAVCAASIDLARTAALEVADPDTVGDHLSVTADAERLVTHRFSCTAAAYPGWEWNVTLARAPRARFATVCEVDLVAGSDALLSPQWLPWSQRIQPSDIGPGDELPRVEDDTRLEAGFEATGDEDVDQVALWELGLGRERVLSREGRLEACERWETGEFGAHSAMARHSARKCRECGFLMPMAGALRQGFGVCANGWSPADGRVIALEYGCGAHSETEPVRRPEAHLAPVLDEVAVDLIALPLPDRAEPEGDQPSAPVEGEPTIDAEVTVDAEVAIDAEVTIDAEVAVHAEPTPDLGSAEQVTDAGDVTVVGSGSGTG